MNTFTFPANKVKAALIFAGTKDIRYYLNAVYFCRHGDAMLAVATDGHRLTVIHDANANDVEGDALPKEFGVIIGRDQLAAALKAHGTAGMPLIFNVEAIADQAALGARKVRILANGGASVTEDREIEGKYPDWEKIIPATFGAIEVREKMSDAPDKVEAYACIDAAYLGDYAKAAKALGANYTGISFAQGANGGPFLVRVADQTDFVSVLMSMRGYAPTRPDWLDVPTVAEVAAEVAAELRAAA